MNEQSIIPGLNKIPLDEATGKQIIAICDNLKNNIDIQVLTVEISRLQSNLNITTHELEKSKNQNKLLTKQIKNQNQKHKDDLARTLAEEKKNNKETIDILTENKDREIKEKEEMIKIMEAQIEKSKNFLAEEISRCTALNASLSTLQTNLDSQEQIVRNKQKSLTTQISQIKVNLNTTQKERDEAVSHKKHLIITLFTSWIGFFIYLLHMHYA